MKILLIPSWFPTSRSPLNGSYFKEQILYLNRKNDIEVKVLFGEKKSSPLFLWIWIYIQSCFKPSWPISNEEVQENHSVFEFRFPANRRVPDVLQITLEKRLFLKAYQSLIQTGWNPALIHAQSGMDAGIFAHHISKQTLIPFVLIEHQVVIFHHYSRKRASLVLNAYRNANRIAAVSETQKRQILMHEPLCNPLVIPNLVDESKFMLSDSSLPSTFQILTIMYPHTIKGFKTFFIVMKKLKEKGIDFKFTVIGKGGEVFKRELHDLGLSKHSELIDTLDRNEIAKIFAKFHIYVCSSDFETFGIAPREAMMCGLPVVSTANGGVEDIINSQTGIVVPVRDAEAMADAILQIKNNYSSYDPKTIRELAIKQCGREVFLHSMLKFYKF